MFLDGLKKFNLFAVVHPGIDEAEDLVKQARKSCARAKKAYEDDIRKQDEARALLLEKCASIQNRKNVSDKNADVATRNENHLFVSLCREWWRQGLERKQREETEAKEALEELRRDAEEGKREMRDRSQTCPYRTLCV